MSKNNFIDILKSSNHYSVFYAEIENEVNGEFVKNLRKKLNMTQNLLASVLGVTKKTIEKWEQGVNPIKGCSARLLYLINKNPSIIKEFYSFEYIPGTPKQLDVSTLENTNIVFSNAGYYIDIQQDQIKLDKKNK
ncbi:MAG: type II toxin-antitoxin system MqsA family antitoxin [Bacilli bacterium]|nr:type II toxin-antitoxin system MqsA family antitoxin [Bacilli bacterium]